MSEEQNRYQICRKDARGCFVESLRNSFGIGKIHLKFVKYDMKRPEKSRQTNAVDIYIAADDFLELCRKMESGEFNYNFNIKKQRNDQTPIYSHLGGTAADKLAKYGRPRTDGRSLSRTAKLSIGEKADLIFSAASGPGDQQGKGIIVPKFGDKPENFVAVSMSLQSFYEFMLVTKAHYEAWLSAWYQKVIAEDEKEMQEEQNQSQRRQYVAQAVPQIVQQQMAPQMAVQQAAYQQMQSSAAAYQVQNQASGH